MLPTWKDIPSFKIYPGPSWSSRIKQTWEISIVWSWVAFFHHPCRGPGSVQFHVCLPGDAGFNGVAHPGLPFCCLGAALPPPSLSGVALFPLLLCGAAFLSLLPCVGLVSLPSSVGWCCPPSPPPSGGAPFVLLFCWVVLLCLLHLWGYFSLLFCWVVPLGLPLWVVLRLALSSFSSFGWGCFPSPLLLGGVAWPPSLGGVALFPLFAWCCLPSPPSLGGSLSKRKIKKIEKRS